MGSPDKVRSPSFTLSNEYHAGRLTLYHFDFYRLPEPGILRDELSELINDPQAVVAVEWADIVEDVLPAEHITVRLRASGEQQREISFAFSSTYAYLFNT
jgi:tRNA threonylcarbamoyladenosine biosynthesis protein TsaE